MLKKKAFKKIRDKKNILWDEICDHIEELNNTIKRFQAKQKDMHKQREIREKQLDIAKEALKDISNKKNGAPTLMVKNNRIKANEALDEIRKNQPKEYI